MRPEFLSETLTSCTADNSLRVFCLFFGEPSQFQFTGYRSGGRQSSGKTRERPRGTGRRQFEGPPCHGWKGDGCCTPKRIGYVQNLVLERHTRIGPGAHDLDISPPKSKITVLPRRQHERFPSYSSSTYSITLTLRHGSPGRSILPCRLFTYPGQSGLCTDLEPQSKHAAQLQCIRR